MFTRFFSKNYFSKKQQESLSNAQKYINDIDNLRKEINRYNHFIFQVNGNEYNDYCLQKNGSHVHVSRVQSQQKPNESYSRNKRIWEHYQTLIKQYETLKSNLIKDNILTDVNINKIENSIESPTNYDDLLFYPKYQTRYENELKNIEKTEVAKLDAAIQKHDEIHVCMDNRAAGYGITMGIGFGLAIFQIPLISPLAALATLTTMVVGAIDIVVNSFRQTLEEVKINEARSKVQTAGPDTKAKIKNEIAEKGENSRREIKQKFFKLWKATEYPGKQKLAEQFAENNPSDKKETMSCSH